eukprot:CFRG4847T1
MTSATVLHDKVEGHTSDTKASINLPETENPHVHKSIAGTVGPTSLSAALKNSSLFDEISSSSHSDSTESLPDTKDENVPGQKAKRIHIAKKDDVNEVKKDIREVSFSDQEERENTKLESERTDTDVDVEQEVASTTSGGGVVLVNVDKRSLISPSGTLNRELFKVVVQDAQEAIRKIKVDIFPDAVEQDVPEIEHGRKIRKEDRLRRKMDINMLLGVEIQAAKDDSITLRKMLFEDAHLAQRRDFFWGYTLLHWAAKMNNAKAIRDLLAAGADPNAQSHGGLTPLHTAAMNGHTTAMRLLLEGGADIEKKSNSGEKARDVATGDPRFLLQSRLQTWDYQAVKQVISSLKSQYM